MKMVCCALAFLAAMLVHAQLAAQEEVRVVVVERFQELDLTDEQEAKIATIQEEHRPKVKAAAQALSTVVKEEVDKVSALLTPEQKEKLAQFKEERKEVRAEGLSERIARVHELDLSDAELAQIEAIRKETRPQIMKAMEGLKGILTEDQRKARQEALQSGKTHAEVLTALKLTDDQKGKVKEVCEEFRTAVKDELQRIGNVLTAQQKATLAEFKDEKKEDVRDRWAHRVANFKDLNLSEEQRAEIAKIRQEYRPTVQEAGNNLRAAIRAEVQAIAGAVKE
jgi:Spy/CpxP family protein refolding chaperone